MLLESIMEILLDKYPVCGGGSLRGIAQLRVKKSEVITDMRVHVEGARLGNLLVDDVDQYRVEYLGDRPKTPGNIRDNYFSEDLLDKEVTIFSDPITLDKGTHTLPFDIPLPPDLPPSVNERICNSSYGMNRYRVTVTLGRKKRSPLSRKEFFDFCDFNYNPLQFIDDFNLPEQKLKESRFQEPFHDKGIGEKIKDKFSKSVQDSSPMLDIALSYPDQGFRQDVGNKFKIVVTTPPNMGPIIVTHVQLDIMAIAILNVNNRRIGYATQEVSLIDHKMNQEGTVVDLGPLLSDVKSPVDLVPCFMSTHYSHTTKLHLKLKVKQSNSKDARVAHIKTEVDFDVLPKVVAQTPTASEKHTVNEEHTVTEQLPPYKG